MRTEVGRYDYIVSLDNWDSQTIAWILDGCKPHEYTGAEHWDRTCRENYDKSLHRLERLGLIERGDGVNQWQFTKAGQVMALTLDGQGLL